LGGAEKDSAGSQYFVTDEVPKATIVAAMNSFKCPALLAVRTAESATT
jgi:hypothetical protein